MKFPTVLLSIAALIFALTSESRAGFSDYTDSTTFFNNISGSFYTESYNGFTYQSQPTSPQSFNNNGFSYNAVAGAGTFYIPGVTNAPADLWLSVFDPTSITFTNFSANISALGGSFFATDFNGAITNVQVSVIATLVDSSIFATNITPAGTNSYLGLTFTTNISSVVISATNGQYATINNMTVGVVPEPSTYALLGLAAAGLAGYVIRRRRA